MAETKDIDLKAAINAVSDVVQNRPRPIRTNDQIYMKMGDMVLQSEMVARWADGKRLAFVGDGDGISLCVAHLLQRKIFEHGPRDVVVYDFDERVCNAVQRFAEIEGIPNLTATLYNALDPFPGPTDFTCFYTNPPWGRSNSGESVTAFMQRGMEATGYAGEGMVVIADDPVREWPQRVLAKVQEFAIKSGFYVQKMQSQLHSYHLDDDPDLQSCNLIIRALPGNERMMESLAISDPARLANFYGLNRPPKFRYVREKQPVEYGYARTDEYEMEGWDHSNDQNR